MENVIKQINGKEEQVNVEYLGDGAYARFDGTGIVLMANDHRHPTDTIYLDPAVIRNLTEFIQKHIEKETR